MSTVTPPSRRFAVIGAGMAGIACARTLAQAGHHVTVFEKTDQVAGRMATLHSAFGSFDPGAQYFTVRDPRFQLALESTPKLCKRWSANAVQTLDELGRIMRSGPYSGEAHWVGVKGMQDLVAGWAAPLLAADQLKTQTRVTHIERDALNKRQWQLRTESPDGALHVFSGFDTVILSTPAANAKALLDASRLAPAWSRSIDKVQVAPCWTLMLAFPQAMQPGMSTLGPQWNAARSTHHRIAWLARESSKPGREQIERWTVQASAAWSQEHLGDDTTRVEAKLLKAFAEVTGIRATPTLVQSHRWLYAKTLQALGQSHLLDAKNGLGVCGDWCLGHRAEDAFISGLELALAAV